MIYESVLQWATSPNVLGWLLCGVVAVLCILFVILFIVKASKVHALKAKIAELEANSNIALANKDSNVATANEKITALIGEKKSLEDENYSLKNSIEELEGSTARIPELEAKIADLEKKLSEKPTAPSMLESEVTPENVNETKQVISRPKNGMYKYTLTQLNSIAFELGIGNRKTKSDAIAMIKLVLDSGKATKAQLGAAMKVIGMEVDSSLNKSALIEIFKKELNK